MTRAPRPPRRGRAPLPEHERKDRLIQTRVPGDLDEALRVEARKQRVTVSQLIRNVLEDTFHLVDGIVANTAHLTESVRRDAQRLAASARRVRPAPPPAEPPRPRRSPAVTDVDAWQEVIVGREIACDGCGVELPRGGKALLGLPRDAKTPRPWLCIACGARLS